ncbi:Hypothetical predicted protein, partial [Prunus dulcis]
GLAWTAYEAFSTLCCSGHYLLPHRQELGWKSRAAVRKKCLTASASESCHKTIFHGSFHSARLKVVEAFGSSESRLRQQQVSAR